METQTTQSYPEPAINSPLPGDEEAAVIGPPPAEPFAAAGFAVDELSWENRPALQPRFPFLWPDRENPRLEAFRRRYDFLDTLAAGGSELQQLLRLRHWVEGHIPHGSPAVMTSDPFTILDSGAAGATFFCSHYARVMEATAAAAGWASRHVGIDSDHAPGTDSTHHGVAEVFVNELGKWVVLDAQNNVHYEKAGVPLSAWELCQESVRDGGKQVQTCVGPEGRPQTLEQFQAGPRGAAWRYCIPASYFWRLTPLHCDPFTIPGTWTPRAALVLIGPAHAGKAWHQGRAEISFPHKGYTEGFFQFTQRGADVDFDVGCCRLELAAATAAAGNAKVKPVRVKVGTLMPNLETLLVQVDGRPAGAVGLAFECPGLGTGESALPGLGFDWFVHEGENTLAVRTRNKFGHLGKPSSIKAVLRAAVKP